MIIKLLPITAATKKQFARLSRERWEKKNDQPLNLAKKSLVPYSRHFFSVEQFLILFLRSNHRGDNKNEGGGRGKKIIFIQPLHPFSSLGSISDLSFTAVNQRLLLENIE